MVAAAAGENKLAWPAFNAAVASGACASTQSAASRQAVQPIGDLRARFRSASGETLVPFSLLISLSPTSDSARSPPSIILALNWGEFWKVKLG